MMIPGVQKPHCDPPKSTNPAAQRSRTAGSSPSIVVTLRPSTRAAAVTHETRGVAVDEDGATPALPLRCAPVLHRHEPESLAQHRHQRLAGFDLYFDVAAVAHERQPIRHRHLRTAGGADGI